MTRRELLKSVKYATAYGMNLAPAVVFVGAAHASTRTQGQSATTAGILSDGGLSNTEQIYFALGNDVVVMARKESQFARDIAALEGKQVRLVVTEDTER